MPEPEENQARKCRPCELSWGLIGLVAGSVILLIAVDLITDGKLTSLATRGASNVAPVIPLKERHDDAG